VGHPIYHLELVAADCRAELALNGFPLISLESANGVPVTFVPPVNPYLCGARNTIEVTIHPATRPGGSLTTFADASVQGNVKRYEKGGIVAPETGAVVVQFGITDELRDRVRDEKLELPVSFTVPFANEAVDFSAELLGGPTFDDREALVAYALHLRDLLAAGDAGGIAAEMQPKAQVWSQAYQRPAEEYSTAIRDALVAFTGGRPVVDFDRDGVELLPCCGGRVWLLARKERKPLLHSDFSDGTNRSFTVYAGVRDGALRVVR
jgi:hypothetical protein